MTADEEPAWYREFREMLIRVEERLARMAIEARRIADEMERVAERFGATGSKPEP